MQDWIQAHLQFPGWSNENCFLRFLYLIFEILPHMHRGVTLSTVGFLDERCPAGSCVVPHHECLLATCTCTCTLAQHSYGISMHDVRQTAFDL